MRSKSETSKALSSKFNTNTHHKMVQKQIDFLNAMEQGATSRDSFLKYIQSGVDLSDLGRKKLSIIGSVSEYDSKTFIESLRRHFDIVENEGEVLLLWAEEEKIPYYVLRDDREFPLFFTAANKTDEIPDTLGEYLKEDQMMSRMWVGKQEMERYRQQMVQAHEHLIIPYFTAKRSKHSEIPAKERPSYDRTISYWADDGLETFRHMKSRYGVLPTNIQFEDPGSFKFVVTQKGVFTSMEGGVGQIADLLQQTVKRLREIKLKIDTGGYEQEQYQDVLSNLSMPCSKPWAIQLDGRPEIQDIKYLENNVAESNLEFRVLNFDVDYEQRSFDAEFMDTEDYGRTAVRTKKEEIRIFPQEATGIDQNIRIYNFIDDHIEPGCSAIEVA